MRRWTDTNGVLEPAPLTAEVVRLLGEMVPGDPRRDLVREAYDTGHADGRAELLAEQRTPTKGPKARPPIPPDALDDFRAFLRAARKRSGLTTYAIANEVGIDPSYVLRMETGERPPANPALVQALARVLRLSNLERRQLLTLAGHAATLQWARALDLVHDTVELLDPEDLAVFTSTIETICLLWRRRI